MVVVGAGWLIWFHALVFQHLWALIGITATLYQCPMERLWLVKLSITKTKQAQCQLLNQSLSTMHLCITIMLCLLTNKPCFFEVVMNKSCDLRIKMSSHLITNLKFIHFEGRTKTTDWSEQMTLERYRSEYFFSWWIRIHDEILINWRAKELSISFRNQMQFINYWIKFVPRGEIWIGREWN